MGCPGAERAGSSFANSICNFGPEGPKSILAKGVRQKGFDSRAAVKNANSASPPPLKEVKQRRPQLSCMQHGLCTESFKFNSAPGKWGRTQMGSDGFNQVLTGFYLSDPARVRAVPSETHEFKGFRPDFNRILTGL